MKLYFMRGTAILLSASVLVDPAWAGGDNRTLPLRPPVEETRIASQAVSPALLEFFGRTFDHQAEIQLIQSASHAQEETGTSRRGFFRRIGRISSFTSATQAVSLAQNPPSVVRLSPLELPEPGQQAPPDPKFEALRRELITRVEQFPLKTIHTVLPDGHLEFKNLDPGEPGDDDRTRFRLTADRYLYELTKLLLSAVLQSSPGLSESDKQQILRWASSEAEFNNYREYFIHELIPQYFARHNLAFITLIHVYDGIQFPEITLRPVLSSDRTEIRLPVFDTPIPIQRLHLGTSQIRPWRSYDPRLPTGPGYLTRKNTNQVLMLPAQEQYFPHSVKLFLDGIFVRFPGLRDNKPVSAQEEPSALTRAAIWMLAGGMIQRAHALGLSLQPDAIEETVRQIALMEEELHEAVHARDYLNAVDFPMSNVGTILMEARAEVASSIKSPDIRWTTGMRLWQAAQLGSDRTEINAHHGRDYLLISLRLAYWQFWNDAHERNRQAIQRFDDLPPEVQDQTLDALSRLDDAALSKLYERLWQELEEERVNPGSLMNRMNTRSSGTYSSEESWWQQYGYWLGGGVMALAALVSWLYGRRGRGPGDGPTVGSGPTRGAPPSGAAARSKIKKTRQTQMPGRRQRSPSRRLEIST
jgi:hypothetical protein